MPARQQLDHQAVVIGRGVARQERRIFVAAEKDTLSAFLEALFLDFGVRFFALRGYSSEPLEARVRATIEAEDRPALLIYAGDHDPSGEDIDRNFVSQVGAFDAVERVALSWDQVAAYGLPPAVGKATDSRAAAFEARHGRLVQVELEALPPDVLRRLYVETFERYWDMPRYQAVLNEERRQRGELDGGAS